MQRLAPCFQRRRYIVPVALLVRRKVRKAGKFARKPLTNIGISKLIVWSGTALVIRSFFGMAAASLHTSPFSLREGSAVSSKVAQPAPVPVGGSAAGS